MLRFLQLIQCALKWSDALDRVSESKYQEALAKLEFIDRHKFGMKVERLLLKALAQVQLNDRAPAKQTLADAMTAIDQSKRFQPPVKIYLKKYAESLFANLLAGRAPDCVRYEGVRLDEVPKHVMRNFPIRRHPNWPKGW
jgi:hypothetical protein